jgi:hypothetical protein
MILLRLLELVIVLFLVYVLFSQILFPAMSGAKLFPVFRKSELKVKVENLKDEVDDLRDVSTNLSELHVLQKRKAEIEAAIEAELAKNKEDTH